MENGRSGEDGELYKKVDQFWFCLALGARSQFAIWWLSANEYQCTNFFCEHRLNTKPSQQESNGGMFIVHGGTED